MVLEHQTQMHNWITRASYEARTAAYQDRGINEALERPLDFESESTGRRIASVGEKLVRYLLMADEFQLTSPVASPSGFTEQFSNRGPQDAHGRSLYQLDLQRRLLKYPCSFLIYSEQFDALPDRVKRYYRSATARDPAVNRTTSQGLPTVVFEDRRAVAEILQHTKSEFWNQFVNHEG